MNKISLPTSALMAGVDFVSGAIEHRHTIPVLTHVLLTVRHGMLCLIGSDLELEMEYRINLDSIQYEGEIPTNWGVTLPAKKFRDLLRSAPSTSDATLTFGDSSTNQHVLTFSGLRSRYTLHGLSASDYPSLPVEKDRVEMTVDLTGFMQAVQSVAFSMANNDVRYYLNGLQFKTDNKQLILTATDGHRLAQNRIAVSLKDDNAQVEGIIPRGSVLQLPAMLKGASGDLILAATPNHLMAKVVVGDTVRVVKTKLVDGRYPDWQRVIPKNSTMEVSFDRVELIGTLRRVSILANNKYRGMINAFSANTLKVSANNPEGEDAVEEIECDGTNSLEVGINSDYFSAALDSFSTARLHAFMTDANSAILLRATPDGEQLCVLMPMRL